MESLLTLDVDKILATAELLRARVEQRFPSSGLLGLANTLVGITGHAKLRTRELAHTNRWVQAAAIVLGVLLALVPVVTLYVGFAQYREVASSLSDMAQGIDAAINEAILLSVALYFLLTLETRRKRNKSLHALHELRSLAHIIDMHQLTKDPERLSDQWQPTEASPARTPLSPFQLERYLDYCSEMLAILSKVAALYVQHFQDEVVLRAVDEVEALTTGLSQKIWQKITILDRLRDAAPAPVGANGHSEKPDVATPV